MVLCFVSIVNEAKSSLKKLTQCCSGRCLPSVHVPVPGLASHLGCYKCRDIAMILSLLPGHQPVMTNVGRWSVMTSWSCHYYFTIIHHRQLIQDRKALKSLTLFIFNLWWMAVLLLSTKHSLKSYSNANSYFYGLKKYNLELLWAFL